MKIDWTFERKIMNWQARSIATMIINVGQIIVLFFLVIEVSVNPWIWVNLGVYICRNVCKGLERVLQRIYSDLYVSFIPPFHLHSRSVSRSASTLGVVNLINGRTCERSSAVLDSLLARYLLPLSYSLSLPLCPSL